MLNSFNLYKKEWLNLVFKNRNQNYGAYLLRQQSSVITMRALFFASGVFILSFAGPVIYRHLKPAEEIKPFVSDRVVDVVLPSEPVKPKEEKKEPLKAEPLQEKVKTVKLPSRIVVVDKPLVEESVPDIKELEHAVIGQSNQQGPATQAQGSTEAKTSGNGSGGTAEKEDNGIYENGTSTLEVYPEFEGGMKAWAKFIQRNLRYPAMAQEECIQGRVFVSFVVEKDGSVSNVTLIRGIGAGCDEEALRVIRKSPNWKAGVQNGQAVRVRYNMPLSFTISQ